MRVCIAALTCFLAVNCWPQEPATPSIVRILSKSEPMRIHSPDEDSPEADQFMVIDGELLLFCGQFKTPDPEAKPFASGTRSLN